MKCKIRMWLCFKYESSIKKKIVPIFVKPDFMEKFQHERYSSLLVYEITLSFGYFYTLQSLKQFRQFSLEIFGISRMYLGYFLSRKRHPPYTTTGLETRASLEYFLPSLLYNTISSHCLLS